jgi:drug/metabolite transporter (DMT)-like permease
MYTALATLGAPRTSSILAGQTAVAVIGSWWLLDDPVVLGQLVGGAFIVAAVVLSARSRSRPPATAVATDPAPAPTITIST